MKLDICIVHFSEAWTDYSLFDLKHPRTQKGHLFAMNGEQDQLCEVVTVHDPHSAWFIGNTIEADGRLQILASMDPLLLAIPYLRSAERCVPLDDLIFDDDFPQTSSLVPLLTRDLMDKIANSKGSPDLNVWVWNEDKCLDYLDAKVKAVKEDIKAKGLTTLDNTSSSNYVSAKRKEESEEDEECKRFAWEFLSDFLQQDLSDKLAHKINLNTSTGNSAKKPRIDGNALNKTESKKGPKEDFSKEYNKVKTTAKEEPNAKQKALARSAKGTKSIASFFGKK